MKEKEKIKLGIIILLIIIIIGLLGYKFMQPNEIKENKEENSQNIENQEIEITINNNVATKKIQLNQNMSEIVITMNINDTEKSDDGVYTTYKVGIDIEINNQKTEKIEDMLIELDSAEELQLKNIIKDISIFKGKDKEYILLLLENCNTYTNVYQNYYIIDENAKILGNFINDRATGIMLNDYSGDYLQVYENYIIKYEIDKNNEVLQKWKYIVNDGNLERSLEKEYKKDEYTPIGKIA